MQTKSRRQLTGQFARGVMMIGGIMILLFAIEFGAEFYRLGMPALRQMSWQHVNNAKLVDSLSPMARAYNNVLAMLIATIGLAIPLTANMHTPKLIDLFLKDRINRVVLFVMVLGAANVLWVIYLIGPDFAPMWAFRVAIYGVLFGWAALLPYYFYVMRFLDPSTIIVRLESDALHHVVQAKAGKIDVERAQAEVQERLFQIGTIVIKSIDRADRSVAREGIWTLKRIVDGYFEHKPDMDEEWFKVDKADFPGMSTPAIEGIAKKHKWMEMHVLYQLLLCYQHALDKAPDAVSAISNVNRTVALKAAERGDTSVISMCVRYFNTFLREALNRGEERAAFDIFYQYRQLAEGLIEHPKFIGRIGGFMVTYASVAEDRGLEFVSDLAGFDLEHMMEQAYRAELPVAAELLGNLLELAHERDGEPRPSRVRAKLIAAGFFIGQGMDSELQRVRDDLADVPKAVVAAACAKLMTIGKRQFWEITDRAVNIEWTDPDRRSDIEHAAVLMGS